MRTLIMATTTVALVLFTGCEKPPETELESARGSIESARSAGAESHAPTLLIEASAYLDSANAEIAEQKKSFLKRDYTEAKRMLGQAQTLAKQAADKATAAAMAAEQAIKEAEERAELIAHLATKDAAEAEINTTYGEYKKLAKKLGKAKVAPVMVDLKAAQTAMKAKDYETAVASAKSAQEKMAALQP